jgi:hypothetical protein
MSPAFRARLGEGQVAELEATGAYLSGGRFFVWGAQPEAGQSAQLAAWWSSVVSGTGTAAAPNAAAAAATNAAAATTVVLAATPASKSACRPMTPAEIESAADGFAESRKIAQGAYGAVYRGELRPEGVQVAIKVLTRKDDEDDKSIYSGSGSFALEAKVLGQYRHANIVALLGHCLGPQLPQQFLVYEFMPGGTLRKQLSPEAGSRLSWQERLVIASDVARGLEFLHMRADPPIIHQDVKSDNILLGPGHIGPDGRELLVAKLADFGAARIEPTLVDESHYSAAEFVGTKPYMPIELIGQGHVSEKTDTFAYGVLLLELLTGKPPSRKGGDFLYSEMHPQLRDLRELSARQLSAETLPRMLDPLLPTPDAAMQAKLLQLARIAARCLEMFARARCAVREVLVEIDVLAGRKAVCRPGRGVEFNPETGSRHFKLPQH